MKYLREALHLAGLTEHVDLRNDKGFDSQNLFREMAVLAPAAVNKLQAGLQWIKNHNIQAVIIGGTAVAHYVAGSRPLTPDVDFLVANMTDVQNKLRQEQIQFTPLAEIGAFSGIQVPQFDTDFLDANSGTPEINRYVFQTARNERVGGATFPIISPEVLAIVKFNIGRDKDDKDAFMLLQSGKMNKKLYLQAVKDLRGYLHDPQSIKMYADMIL